MTLPNDENLLEEQYITELKRAAELAKLNEDLQREINERRSAEQQLEQRTNLLSTLLDVSNLVSSTLDLKPLLEAILDRLKKIIDYEGAKIFIINGEVLRVIAHRSRLTNEEEQVYVFTVQQMPVTREIIQSKSPVVIPDVLSGTQMAYAFRETAAELIKGFLSHVRSWIGIPLMVKDKVVGILTMDHSEPEYYHPEHVELGMAFANQVAIEYENARLYSEILRKADELKTMFAVQQAITSRLDRHAVLKRISDDARRLTNSDRAAVFLVEGKDLVLSVFSGSSSSDFLGYRLSLDKSAAGKYLLSGESLIINDAPGNPEVYTGLAEKAGLKSFLSIPLMFGSKPIGTISVADKRAGEFNSDDERVLKMLGSTAVIALENSRMYQEEKRRHMEDEQRRHVAEVLRDILAILNSNRPLADILDFIIHKAAQIMGTDTGAIYRLQKDKDSLEIEAAMGLPDEYISHMSIPNGMGVAGQAVLTRKPVVVSDFVGQIPEELKNDPGRTVHLSWLEENYHGLLAVPIVCKDEIYGAIVLYYHQVREFSKDEIALLTTFGDQAALAIDNARLRAQTEEMAVAAERSRLARDLHDAVTQTLFSASLIAEVLPKIWERNQEEGRKRLQELKQLTRGALAEMRTLLLELRPATLIESGLKELLSQLTVAVTGRTRIPINLEIEGQPNLPADVKIAFYRITQEALNNIAKHSGASGVTISLESFEGDNGKTEKIKLSVCDNGRGFDGRQVSPQSLGLGIMKERSEAIGAEFKMESCIGEGTKVTVQWEMNKGGNAGE